MSSSEGSDVLIDGGMIHRPALTLNLLDRRLFPLEGRERPAHDQSETRCRCEPSKTS
jgi:hypothetical protein